MHVGQSARQEGTHREGSSGWGGGQGGDGWETCDVSWHREREPPERSRHVNVAEGLGELGPGKPEQSVDSERRTSWLGVRTVGREPGVVSTGVCGPRAC